MRKISPVHYGYWSFPTFQKEMPQPVFCTYTAPIKNNNKTFYCIVSRGFMCILPGFKVSMCNKIMKLWSTQTHIWTYIHYNSDIFNTQTSNSLAFVIKVIGVSSKHTWTLKSEQQSKRKHCTCHLIRGSVADRWIDASCYQQP